MNLPALNKEETADFDLDPSFLEDWNFLSRKVALNSELFHLFLIGGTGSGKSTLLNSFAGKELAKEGVVRPTTSRITIYLHEKHLTNLKPLAVNLCSHNLTELESFALWDFPDFDSYSKENHEVANLFQEYADLLVLVLHPEKYNQKNLFEFLSSYPQIPQACIISHADLIKGSEKEAILESLQKRAGYVFCEVYDFKQEQDRLQSELTDHCIQLKKRGLREFKKETVQNLKEDLLARASSWIDSLKIRLNQIQERCDQLNSLGKELEPVSREAGFEVFREGIVSSQDGIFYQRLMDQSSSYFSLIFQVFSKFFTRDRDSVLPHLSLPYLELERKLGGKFSFNLSQEEFQRQHFEVLDQCKFVLQEKSQNYGIKGRILDFLLDYLAPVALLGYLLFYLESFPYSFYLNLGVLVFYLLVAAFLFYVRIRNRMKSIYMTLQKDYVANLRDLFDSVLKAEIKRVESELEELRTLKSKIEQLEQLGMN